MMHAIILSALLLGTQEVTPTLQELQATYDYFFSPEQQQEFNQLTRKWDQDRYWQKFWNRLDPTPKTDRNEILLLFRERMDWSVPFGSFGDGWKEDMGHVLICFGPPQEVYRSPETIQEGVRQEVWVYRKTVNGQVERVELVFVFNEESDSFKLTTPVVFPRTIFEEVILPKLKPADE